MKGLPTVITIDDYLPYYGSDLIFDRQADNGALWVSILEKAFAKLNGNYEGINFGWQSESYHILTGAPAGLASFAGLNYDLGQVWSMVTNALTSNYFVGCDTSSTSLFNIPTAHAYSIFGAYELKDVNG